MSVSCQLVCFAFLVAQLCNFIWLLYRLWFLCDTIGVCNIKWNSRYESQTNVFCYRLFLFAAMHLSYRKKLFGCFLILVVCLWVIYQTTILAVKYEKLVNSLNWELDRCFHKQGLDSKGRLGSGDLYSHFTIQGYPGDLTTVSPAVFEHSPRLFTARAPNEQRGGHCQSYLCVYLQQCNMKLYYHCFYSVCVEHHTELCLLYCNYDLELLTSFPPYPSRQTFQQAVYILVATFRDL